MSELLYMPQMAEKLGTTVTALRSKVDRMMNQSQRVDLPRPIRLGKKYAWRIETVENWLKSKELDK